MLRAYYSASIADFLQASTDEVLGKLSRNNDFALIHTQRDAWVAQIDILNSILDGREGSIYFEYSIPRMGRRIDAVLLIGPVIFVIEFKVGEKTHTSYAFDQVFDYALDLKNFHESSHEQYIAPVLVATEAGISPISVEITPQNDKLIFPLKSNKEQLGAVINAVLRFVGEGKLDVAEWEAGRYCPTPTIIEAAMALYNNHAVADITRSDAGATNLRLTSSAISEVIQRSKERSQKALCFVTGVPGAGKTLVGIDVATKHSEAKDDLYSVYLSGNGPLVKILCEALARDKVSRGKSRGDRVKIGEARSAVKSFIQNVHHFRDDCLQDSSAAPIEHGILSRPLHLCDARRITQTLTNLNRSS